MNFRDYLSLVSDNIIAFETLPTEKQITEESLRELEQVIAERIQKNEGVLSLSGVLAARTSLD